MLAYMQKIFVKLGGNTKTREPHKENQRTYESHVAVK